MSFYRRLHFHFSAFVISNNDKHSFPPKHSVPSLFRRFVTRHCQYLTPKPSLRPTLSPSLAISDLIFPGQLSISIPATPPCILSATRTVMKCYGCNYRARGCCSLFFHLLLFESILVIAPFFACVLADKWKSIIFVYLFTYLNSGSIRRK